jgi:diaminohydroxyphosphoribosylaminopyrimidine deaminase/5-amino-6-(5-phosphoribosylamino)uracil reductase
MKFSRTDERFMRRALVLAQRGLGKTSPNPVVGAVLVRNDRIIGEGWHRQAGGPHAEVFALRGVNARGAVLYVTMEPCCTWGKTPPCTDAIVAAGMKRVVVAALDPNPKHDGRGLTVLRRAGIRVESGLLAADAAGMNAAFNKWITTGLPLIIAKAAISADGKIATRTGDSKWITSDAARREAHKLRAGVDAIIVGANTVIRDDPRLTVRHGVRGRQPLRVVVDGQGRVPRTARLFTDRFRDRTILVTTKSSPAVWRRHIGNGSIEVLTVTSRRGKVELREALRALGKLNVTSALVEGGGELLGSMFDARLVDKVVFLYAPLIIGGRQATTVVAGVGAERVNQAVRLGNCRWRRIGEGEMLLQAEVAG